MTNPLHSLPTLQHCLQTSTWRQLRRLMAHHALPTSRQQRKADLVETLHNRLADPTILQGIIPQLSPVAYRGLAALIAADGALPAHRFAEHFGPFPAHTTTPATTPATTDPPAPTAELAHWGLIYRHRWDRQTHEAVVLPAELFAHLQPFLHETAPAATQQLLWWGRPGRPPDLLWHLAVWLATVAGQAVRLIHGRWLPPRVVATLVERIGLDQDPAFVPRRSERYLPYLAFLHYLAESAGFVEGTVDLTLTPTAWAWLAVPLAERRAALWEAWRTAPTDLADAYRFPFGALAPKARALLVDTLTTLATNGTLAVGAPLPPDTATAEAPGALPLPHLVAQLRLHDPWGLLPGLEELGVGELGGGELGVEESGVEGWGKGEVIVDAEPRDGALSPEEPAPHPPASDAADLFAERWELAEEDERLHVVDKAGCAPGGAQYSLLAEEDERLHAVDADPLIDYCTGPLFWLDLLDLGHATTPQRTTPQPDLPVQVRLGRHGRLWLRGETWSMATHAPQPVHSPKDAADLYIVTPLVQPLHLATLARLCRWETLPAPPFHFQLYLDDQKVATAAAHGITAAEMANDLIAALGRPLSRREGQRLRARVAAGRQAWLRTLTVLETQDAETMASLRRRKLVRDRLGSPVGPNRVEVNPADASALAQTLATLGLALHVPPAIEAAAELQPERSTELAPTFQWMLLQIYRGLGKHAALPVKAPWWAEQALAAQLSPVQRAAATAAARQLLAQIDSGMDGYLRIPAWQLAQENDGVRAALDTAIANEAPLTIRYWTTTHGEPITRTITPYWIESRYDTDYLVAYCHLRNEERTFRVDRIAEVG